MSGRLVLFPGIFLPSSSSCCDVIQSPREQNLKSHSDYNHAWTTGRQEAPSGQRRPTRQRAKVFLWKANYRTWSFLRLSTYMRKHVPVEVALPFRDFDASLPTQGREWRK